MGITTGPEAEAYDNAKAARVSSTVAVVVNHLYGVQAGYRPLPPRDRPEMITSGARVNAGQHRFLHNGFGTPPPGSDPKRHGDGWDSLPRIPGHGARRPRELMICISSVIHAHTSSSATPLNLSNATSLDLLSSEERSLCSTLRVLPKPYLTIKEMYIRENERRRGLLKRRDARFVIIAISVTTSILTACVRYRNMLKIDVNKSGRIFDFLVESGMLDLAYDPVAKGLRPGKEAHILGLSMDGSLHRPDTHEIFPNMYGAGMVVNEGPGG